MSSPANSTSSPGLGLPAGLDLSSGLNVTDTSGASLFSQLRCVMGDFEQRKACRAACTVDTCPLVLSYWGYRPNIPINAAFAAIFVVFLTIVLVQGVWTRRFKKYTAMMFIGMVMEVMGYVARIYANSYPFSDISFITQLTTLTLAPAFFAAAIYFSLSHIVVTFGKENSRISPRKIPRIFITCDVISLILQGTGGALAAWYAQQEKMPDNGNYTLIGGLSFQAFTLLVFLILSADFAVRTIKSVRSGHSLNENVESMRLRKSGKFKGLIFSLTISAILIFVRSVYRVIELSEGWKGELMTNERFVILLEAVPVAIAGFLLSVFHPANCFKQPPKGAAIDSIEMYETPSVVSSTGGSGPGGRTAMELEKQHQLQQQNHSQQPNGLNGHAVNPYQYQYHHAEGNNRPGNMNLTMDPTFDRKNWR